MNTAMHPTSMASLVAVSASPQTTIFSSENEEFPALPAAVEPASARIAPSQPPVVIKPPPAPPVPRKSSVLAKPTKVETKKTPAVVPTKPKSTITEDQKITENNLEERLINSEASSNTMSPSLPSSAKPKTPPPVVSKPVTAKPKPVSTASPAVAVSEPIEHAPIVARQTKKSKPQQASKKRTLTKEESSSGAKESTPEPPAPATPAEVVPEPITTPVHTTGPEELLEQLQNFFPLNKLSFFTNDCFEEHKLLEYRSLVEGLTTLSAYTQGNSNAAAQGAYDGAVSSFQQLLVTLTQTISDLLHLLPRTTWSDSIAFDAVIQEMLKSDYLDDHTGDGKRLDTQVVSTLESRALWMQQQCQFTFICSLSLFIDILPVTKLEELHHDINYASTRAVLTVNDRGWDSSGFLPRVGGTASVFETLGTVEVEGELRGMSASELQAQLSIAQKEVSQISDELRRTISHNSKFLTVE